VVDPKTVFLTCFLLLVPTLGFAQEARPIDNGLAAFNSGRFEEAIAIFTSILESSDASDQDRRDARIDRGSIYTVVNRFDEAIADFSAAIEADPEAASIYLSRATAWGRKGDRDRALGDFERALKINPQYAEAYYNRGRLRGALGETEAAIADVSTALRLNPTFSMAALELANLHASRGETSRAIEVLSGALKAAEHPYVLLSRGNFLMKLGQPSKAVDDYSRAIALAPSLTSAYANRGSAYMALHRAAEAVRDFEAVLVADPGDVEMRVNRASANMVRGEIESAIADFSSAIESGQAPAETLYYRAMAHLGRGSLREAHSDLVEYVSNHAGDKYGAIMLYVVSARVGGPSPNSALRPFVDTPPKEWPDVIIHFLAGKMTRADFLASIRSTSANVGQRVVEGNYYLGQECLIRGDQDCARRHFETAIARGLITYLEHQGATAELRLLAAPK
jgi:tetratricopeptide (TPR) repeat protein